MFDIGFSEIVVIAVVALVVIGPEKLPKTARTAGLLLGRLQRYVNDVKSDINREIELDELRKMQQQMKSAVQDIETSVNNVTQEVQTGLRSVESDLNSTGTATADAASTLPASPPSDSTPPTSPLPESSPALAETPAPSLPAPSASALPTTSSVSGVAPEAGATVEHAAEMTASLDAFEGTHALDPAAAARQFDAIVSHQAALPGLETPRVVREDPR